MRVRDFGVVPGRLPTGGRNAIIDVPGVRVGHVTLIEGEGDLSPVGPVRTGVTAIVPHGESLYHHKVSAGCYTINGFGKAVGFEQIRTRGQIETPILLTNTLAIGRTADALIGYMLDQHPEIGLTSGTVCPVVGECYDGFLNNARGRSLFDHQVREAIQSASVENMSEGCIGAGTGTAAFGFKGGIGTSSRVVRDAYTVGALVQTNYGERAELSFLGVPLGQHLLDDFLPVAGAHSQQSYAARGGSIMFVIATDAPLDSRQLTRLASRAALGLARTGTVSHDQSGDFVIAFSTAHRWEHKPSALHRAIDIVPEGGDLMNGLFLAVVESVEEAILNAMTAARDMTGRDGNTLYALPHDVLTHWLKYYRRIAS
jgi:D-aminopeptidase